MAKPDWRCGAARGLPIDRTRPWDGPAAEKRMLDAAEIGGKRPRPDAAKRGFLLYDASAADLRGSYKLPFADLIDGRLTACESGIDAAADMLSRTDAPDREKARARLIIDDYERRMGRDRKDAAAGTQRFGAPAATHQLAHIAQRCLNTPLALHPAKAEMIIAALAERLGVAELVRAGAAAAPMPPADRAGERGDADRGYEVIDKCAVIPVLGTLVHRLGSVRPISGMTGYDGIRANFQAALADPDVRGIVFHVDSPGGEVSGCFGLADEIFRARGQKPMLAIVDEAAYSAAYAIASAADEIVAPRTGGVGSIGVIAMVADISRALEGAGVRVNVIQFGARKADGLEVLPMTEEARARFQADVDEMGTLFVETVTRNRNLDAGFVRGTEAATFLATAAKKNKLITDVAEPQAAFRDFARQF